ncbi:MAG: hypothetical protein BM556_00835 [Bacteriovorax sp. MedPE-SWde]|nr:MAG: hypothetical protein BM556_00835 [Bacteriovorax sp. MedPE-SWde]
MKRKIIGAFVVIFIILGAISYGVVQYSFSHGVRSGKLVKLSQKGVLFKTYEGTLDLGSGDELTWQFSIHDDALGEQLVKQTGQTVRLEYRELLYKLFFGTKYDVEGWSLVGESNDLNYLCRLVDIMRSNSSIVNYLRPLLEKEDTELLKKIRACQK